MEAPSKTKRHQCYWPMVAGLICFVVVVILPMPSVIKIVLGLFNAGFFFLYLYIVLSGSWCPRCQVSVSERKEAKFCHGCGLYLWPAVEPSASQNLLDI